MAEHHAKTSPYYDTPLSQSGSYLDILRFRPIPLSDKDATDYEIPPAFAHRPDLIANHFYGNPEYWWVFMVANMDTVLDPIADLETGVKIRVPDPQRIFGLLG